MSYTKLNQSYSGATYNNMDFTYDEAGLRIKKTSRLWYRAWVPGGGEIEDPLMGASGGSGSSGLLEEEPARPAGESENVEASSIDSTEEGIDLGGSIGGGAAMNGSGPGGGEGYWVYYNDSTETHYLYNGSTLIAIFDARDSVQQLYVNGAGGPVAVYDDNKSTKRYYFLKDQVGTTRVVVNDTGLVCEYIDYQPFGEVYNSYASYDEPLKFTGKERDAFQTFDYTYFGARYYDPRTGRFTSIDKAAQFASGFNYGGNNPIIGADPDGNWFLFAAAIAATFMYTYHELDQYESDPFGRFLLAVAYTAQSTAYSCMGAATAGSTGSVLFARSSVATISSGEPVLDFGIGTYTPSNGKVGWRDFNGDFLSDVQTVQGHMDFSADYAKVMSRVDMAVFGEQQVESGKDAVTNDELRAATEPEPKAFGRVKFAEITEEVSVNTWAWYKHVNPVDMLMHGLSQVVTNLLTGTKNNRWPNGWHHILSTEKEPYSTIHRDLRPPMYYLNVLNHLVFESELLKLFYPDPKGGWPDESIFARRVALSKQIRFGYNMLERW